MFLLLFIEYWNDYQRPLVYLGKYPTLVYQFILLFENPTGYGSTYRFMPAQMALCMTILLPIVVMFICFNKQLIGNISLGGLKE